jgi:hypothetical protein
MYHNIFIWPPYHLTFVFSYTYLFHTSNTTALAKHFCPLLCECFLLSLTLWMFLLVSHLGFLFFFGIVYLVPFPCTTFFFLPLYPSNEGEIMSITTNSWQVHSHLNSSNGQLASRVTAYSYLFHACIQLRTPKLHQLNRLLEPDYHVTEAVWGRYISDYVRISKLGQKSKQLQRKSLASERLEEQSTCNCCYHFTQLKNSAFSSQTFIYLCFGQTWRVWLSFLDAWGRVTQQ